MGEKKGEKEGKKERRGGHRLIIEWGKKERERERERRERGEGAWENFHTTQEEGGGTLRYYP